MGAQPGCALPGFFRPTKDWDLVVHADDRPVVAIEFKSQNGPSFSNNANNRVEEAIGNAVDLWYVVDRELLPARPWVGYVYVIEDDPATRAGSAAALSRAGFAVTVAGSVEAAKAAVRRGAVDVLVMAERVGGRLAHDVALLAELRNPALGTIMLSDRTADEADEIFALLPSLHAVLGRSTPPRMLTDLALASARWQGHEAPAVPPQADAAPPAPQTAGPVARPPGFTRWGTGASGKGWFATSHVARDPMAPNHPSE